MQESYKLYKAYKNSRNPIFLRLPNSHFFLPLTFPFTLDVLARLRTQRNPM